MNFCRGVSALKTANLQKAEDQMFLLASGAPQCTALYVLIGVVCISYIALVCYAVYPRKGLFGPLFDQKRGNQRHPIKKKEVHRGSIH